jgi:hypothetical protein
VGTTKCPSTDEWINKIWFILTGMESNKVLMYATMWIKLENIIIHKRSQS